jgi:hypothetical protein
MLCKTVAVRMLWFAAFVNLLLKIFIKKKISHLCVRMHVCVYVYAYMCVCMLVCFFNALLLSFLNNNV